MSEFEFISVLYSIVVAFPLSEIMAGWGKMMRRRHAIRIYWPHLCAMFLTAMLLIQFWWSTWQYQGIQMTFLDFFIVLLGPLTFVLLGAVVTPEVDDESQVNLREYYWRNYQYIYGLAALTLLELAVADIVVDNESQLSLSKMIRLFATLLVASLAAVKSERYHKSMVVVLVVLLVLFIAFGSATLSVL